ncbi:MAG: hypothetical protein ACFFD2_20425 [Promethearchaeota archaeon]
MSEQERGIEESSEFFNSIKDHYELLNTNEKFKDQFKGTNFKLLLNPTDRDYAALITVDNGTVSVEGIKNASKENLKKETLGWDSSIKTKIQIFKEMGEGTLSSSDIRKMILKRKIKVKGLKELALFSDMSALLQGESE